MFFLFPVFIYDNDNDDNDDNKHHHHHHHWSSKVHDLDLVLQRVNKQANNSLSYADDDNYNNNDNNDKKTTTTTQYLSIQSIHAINNILKVTSYRSAKNKTIYNGNTNNTESHKLKYVTGLWANRRLKCFLLISMRFWAYLRISLNQERGSFSIFFLYHWRACSVSNSSHLEKQVNK